VQTFGANPGPLETIAGIALGLLVAMLAGAINGWIVAYLRLQPIIATFATSSLWAGVALWVLPQPGGIVPQSVQDFVRLTVIPPFALIVIALMLLVWAWWLGTRNARALYAVGGSPQAAFASGVNVPFVKLSSYAVSGLIAGFAALFLIGDLATGDPYKIVWRSGFDHRQHRRRNRLLHPEKRCGVHRLSHRPDPAMANAD
jgi:ribose transport system permease protein